MRFPQMITRWTGVCLFLACSPSDPNDQGEGIAAIALANVPAGPVLVGSRSQLAAHAVAATGDTVPDVLITWQSSDQRRATVSASGLVAALDTGLVEISASAGGQSAKAALDLRTGGGLGPGGGTLVALGGAVRVDAPAGALDQPLVLFVRPMADPIGNVRVVPGTVVELSPINTSLAGVTLSIRYDPSRLLAALPENSLQLYFLSGTTWTQVRGSRVNTASEEVSGAVESTGIYAVASTAVSRIELAGLPPDRALFPTESRQLVATPVDEFGAPLTGHSVVWTSTDTTKATISDGMVTAVAPGQATLRATADGQTAEAALTILPGSGATLDSLRVGLSVMPSHVPFGQSFTARWFIKNIGRSRLTITFPDSCLGYIGVFRGDQRQGGFPDTDYGCLTAVTARPVFPGDSLTEMRTIRTDLAAAVTPRDNYDFRVQFRTFPELPAVSHPLSLR